MKIAVVTPFFTPKAGGSATSAYVLTRSMQSRGHDVTVFTSDWGRKTAPFEHEESLNIEESRCEVDAFGFLYSPGMRKRMEKHSGEIELMDLNNYRTYQNTVARKFALEQRIPYVLHARGSMPRLGKAPFKWAFDNMYGYKILGNSSRAIALTKVESLQYESFGVRPQNISIIPNGVALSDFDHLPAKGKFRSAYGIREKALILFLGRIHEIKGIDTLVRAYALLRSNSQYADSRLVIAGPDAGYLSKAKTLAKALKVDSNVSFCGPLGQESKLAALVDANLIVLPSNYETFPNTILEAFACSRPVVASRVLAIEDLVSDGETGLLVQPKDAAGLSKAISFMLGNPDKGETMGRRGRALVEECYNMDIVTNLVESLYKDLLNKS